MAQRDSASLDDHFAGVLSHELASGRYRSASEVAGVELGLREDNETHVSALRAVLADGEEGGPAEAFDFDSFVAAKKRRSG